MYYVDTQRSLTRRSSSLLATTVEWEQSLKEEIQSTARGESTTQISEASANLPPKGPVEKELIAVLFENMLGCVIESWEPILPAEENLPTVCNPSEKLGSESIAKSAKRKDEKRGKKIPFFSNLTDTTVK